MCSFIAFSQEMVKSVNLKINKKADVFQIVDEERKQVTFFFNESKVVKSIRFNDSFEVIDSLSMPRPSEDFDDIVGYSASGNKYWSYWFNGSSKEVLSQCFDFETRQNTVKNYKLELEKERIIKKITVKDVFYITTILKNTNILNFYVFKDNSYEKKTVDLSDKKFLNNDDKVTSLWNIVSTSTTYDTPLTFQTISNETPPSIALSANKRKIYSFENNVVFSIDNNRNFTQTISVNLENFSVDCKNYNKPYLADTDFDITDSNSFLLKEYLVQLKSNSNTMIIVVKNLEGNELKRFNVVLDKDISFKNSDIFQENGSIKNMRVLDKSNQLLRKINNMNPSLSVFTSNDKNYMIIGGVSLVQSNNGAMIGGMLGGFTGALIGAAISSNYSMNNLNSYRDRKVVYINCLFDKDFNHIEGNLNRIAFNELRRFAEENNDLIIPSIFKLNSNLYFSGYNKETKNYIFYKFSD